MIRRVLRSGALAGLAAGGVVAGHVLGFLLSEPDAYRRAAALEATGHHRFAVVAVLGVAAAVAGLVALVVSRGAGASNVSARQLALLQISGFVLLEGCERIFGHAHLASLVPWPFWVGLAAQVLIAFLGVRALRGVVRLLARRRRPRPVPARFRRPKPGRRSCGVRWSSGGVRAPPRAA